MNLYSDRGVVLHSLKYSENQLIVHILTCDHGRQSYITRIAGKGSGRNLYQPLSLVEFHAVSGKGDLHKLSQTTIYHSFCDIPFNIVKSTIALFISEVLYRTIKDESVDNRFFEFVSSSIVALDLMEGSVANFHLHFMVRLMHYMGFSPQDRHVDGAWFDIKNGSFVTSEPNHLLRLEPAQAWLLGQLSRSNIEQAVAIELNRDSRSLFLDSLVDMYGYHTDSIYSVNSIAMFREIF